jgi:outer membrane protein, heavy metal efflux system
VAALELAEVPQSDRHLVVIFPVTSYRPRHRAKSFVRSLIAVSFLIAGAGCAAQMPMATPSSVVQRTGVPARPAEAQGTALPPGVALDDGLTQDEAVAIALWNNPDFQVQLANLGFARADLVEAGLLQNPVLSLLFPWGPKQLEATVRWPVEMLWQRPRRVAAARLAADSIAAGLEQDGLTLVSDVKLAYTEYALALDRTVLAERALKELNAIAMLMDSRFQAGDISQLEARTAAIDAARARQDVERARLDATLRANELRARLGLALEATDAPPMLTPAAPTTCPVTPALLNDALAARPDVRAAELAVEAAGSRLGWERSRVLTFTAVLDANGEGTEGFELGPGVDAGLPFFNRNQGLITRAQVELQRASGLYLAARQRVATEVRAARTQYERASVAAVEWRTTVLEPLEEQVAIADRAFNEGEVAYLFVIEMNRRLTDARLRTREAEADIARAQARLERAVGRRCGTTDGGRTGGS